MGEYEPNDSRRVTLNPADRQAGLRPREGWHDAEASAGERVPGYEPEDSRHVTRNPDDRKPGQRAEPGWHETEVPQAGPRETRASGEAIGGNRIRDLRDPGEGQPDGPASNGSP